MIERKSERTKSAIRAAARQVFALVGYERATIRDIAREANIDPAMVMRYFGSKDGLFADTANFDLNLPQDLGEAPDKAGERMAAHFIAVWEQEGSGFAVLLRSASSNPVAAARIAAVLSEQLLPAVVAMVGPQEAPQRAGLIASQMLGLALSRYVLSLGPVAAMSREQIIAGIGPTLQRYLYGPLAR
ncbi:MAG: transcriptional regulator [Devosia sp.]|uniref:TetR/AcrR family transcriptional regulator n=1 Tax=Devosia sp. TaxID=1871048 RepID=UPI0026102239|nr:TetR family transcriptional regulator [Devosia sp.]MDB5588835.1 transcriptional regulator [Devosia sp.]